MTDEPDSIVLRYLRRMDDRLNRIEHRLDEMASEARATRAHLAGFMQDHQHHYDSNADLRARVDRIERRLEIQDDAS